MTKGEDVVVRLGPHIIIINTHSEEEGSMPIKTTTEGIFRGEDMGDPLREPEEGPIPEVMGETNIPKM